MGLRRSTADAARDRVHRQSVDRVEYVVVEIDGVERKVPAGDIVEIRGKGRYRPRVGLGAVKLGRGERVRHSVDGVIEATKPIVRVRVGASKKGFPAKGTAPRQPSFDELSERERADVLHAWEEAAAVQRASLNYVEEFERSGRQYSEADGDGNVLVHQRRG
ncbi:MULTISPECIES: hypothetical protein [Microbacterium]|uniref:hypothetical protein n=1 Tax=Microbacterium TaxID=33882 RepID=UPI002781EF7A|nr:MULTISPECIES: hypothetical protein [Microbacterium]MDQ1075717.1 hypothetical protein [Microbacterium sp. SORGH_AS_0969]MDQ1115960.1 hypothetical protein [Microbacterium testaceum]